MYSVIFSLIYNFYILFLYVLRPNIMAINRFIKVYTGSVIEEIFSTFGFLHIKLLLAHSSLPVSTDFSFSGSECG